MDRLYFFKTETGKEVVVRCINDAFMTGEEIKTLEAAGSKLQYVRYGRQYVKVDNRRI